MPLNKETKPFFFKKKHGTVSVVKYVNLIFQVLFSFVIQKTMHNAIYKFLIPANTSYCHIIQINVVLHPNRGGVLVV